MAEYEGEGEVHMSDVEMQNAHLDADENCNSDDIRRRLARITDTNPGESQDSQNSYESQHEPRPEVLPQWSDDDGELDALERPDPPAKPSETPERIALESPFASSPAVSTAASMSVPRGELGSISRQVMMQTTPSGRNGRRNSHGGGGDDDDGNGGGGDSSDNEESQNGSDNNPAADVSDDEEMQDEDEDAVIYGTTVNVKNTLLAFKRFLRGFKLTDEEEEPHYFRVLREIHETRELVININCEHLEKFSEESLTLYKHLIRYPQEMVPLFDFAVYKEFTRRFPNDPIDGTGERIQVRTFNLHKVGRMRQLDPDDLDMLVAIRGMVIRVSPIIPDMKMAKFRCTACRVEQDIIIDRGMIQEPKICAACNKRGAMQLIHNLSRFSDKQMIKLQESPENIPEGETPQTLSIYAYDSLVDVSKPGDRVEVTGIFRAVASRKHPQRRTVGSIYKTYLDVIHFKQIQKGSITEGRNRQLRENHLPEANPEQAEDDDEDAAAPAVVSLEQQEETFREMARDPQIYSRLAHSVAPSIWELEDVKKGVLLLLIGGTNKEVTQQAGDMQTTHRMRSRGEINILLCGDPGTSKSQILGYVHKLAPRGIYTSGKGSSAVGLTAYVSKDPDTKELVLESGALVLSDRGVCCIDEFDKMNDTTRAILHECMEQQTISIAKAGIIATLNARTSILASANPVQSRYNPKLSMVQNIQLPPTLLSRFDLIYLVLDKPDKTSDRRLAKHLVALYFQSPRQRYATVDRTTLREYISYCRRTCFPQIGTSAVRKLVQGYVDMRQAGSMNGGKKTISATPRQLESLIRLSEAHAKLHLREEVGERDVDEAIRLMRVATQLAAVDPRTGLIDMDAITTGIGSSERALNEQLAQEVFNLLQEENQGISITQILGKINEQATSQVRREAIVRAIRLLRDDEKITFDERSGIAKVLAAIE